jgi:hypothetical protein
MASDRRARRRVAVAHAPEPPDPRTLIPSNTLNATAPHISGVQTRNHVLEPAPLDV